MPAKILGVAFVACALLFRWQFIQSHRRGYVRVGRAQINRADGRLRFALALGPHALGALICFVAAYLCLIGTRHAF